MTRTAYLVAQLATVWVAVGHAATPSPCPNYERLWEVSQSQVSSYGGAVQAFARMLSVTPDNVADKSIAMIVAYEATSVQEGFVFVMRLVAILHQLRDKSDREAVVKHLETELDSFLQRTSIAVDSINSYAAQMRSPAFSQQAISLRDQIDAIRKNAMIACSGIR